MQATLNRAVAALTLSSVLVGPVGAQPQSSNEELKKELQTLQEGLKAIQRDLQEIKGMLARQAPAPSGIGAVIDFGTSPVKGEQTAKLTLVEFSDYQ
jgi:protein-disulfide isomerase